MWAEDNAGGVSAGLTVRSIWRFCVLCLRCLAGVGTGSRTTSNVCGACLGYRMRHNMRMACSTSLAFLSLPRTNSGYLFARGLHLQRQLRNACRAAGRQAGPGRTTARLLCMRMCHGSAWRTAHLWRHVPTAVEDVSLNWGSVGLWVYTAYIGVWTRLDTRTCAMLAFCGPSKGMKIFFDVPACPFGMGY